MGPPLQCSWLYLVDWCVCNIFPLGLIRCSLVSNLGVPHHVAGAQHVKCQKNTTRELGPIQTYKRVVHCYDVKEVFKPHPGYKKDQVLAIWATCKLCKYKKPGFKAFSVKTKISNCGSWSGCVKHVENVHYLDDLKDVEEALTNPKAHWDDLEDRKARLWGVNTRIQGQSTLDECMEEYKPGSAERKR